MCGILGVVYRDPTRIADRSRLLAARQTLVHRGPDEAGAWFHAGVALAHQRLKVLDLTHGQQPMVDGAAADDPRYALVYNGEVYNFRELQAHYRKAGLTFETRCDTEVVFKALNHEGPAAIDRFNGMFALAHWDQQARSLLLVRDRLGKKPLYWFADDEQLVFASELKAVLEFLGRRFAVDPVALDQFFARGYVLSPRTIFAGIQKLPAGNLLKLEARAGRWEWRVGPYWDFQPREVPGKPEDILDQLDELLTDAVRVRLVSDVPIGCLLSGGIDSSLVTALAAKVCAAEGAEPVKAFSIGFDEAAEFNELPYAKMVAERHGCHWFHRTVRGGDFMAMVEDASRYYDEPFGNFTMFSMRRLAQMAREQLVVVLTGQGGDELCGGYPGRYNWVLDHAAAAAERQKAVKYAPALDDVLTYLRASSFIAWPRGRDMILSEPLKQAICAAATPMTDLAPFWDRRPQLGRLNNVLYADVKTNLADYLICLEERMTMSCSLEARNPMLDPRVVDFMLSLPESAKITGAPPSPRRNKWALLELARRYVPAEAIDRPKRGFTPPLGLWVEQNAARLAEVFHETDAQTRGVYSEDWRSYLLAGRYEAATVMPVFYSLMLASWVKHYARFIGDWPCAGGPAVGVAAGAGASVSIDIAPQAAPVREPWQRALRFQDAEALGEARWFCQAMGNLDPGTPVRVLGDDTGWFGFLAKGSGLSVVEAQERAVVLVGSAAAKDFLSDAAEMAGVAAGTWVLFFVPFPAQDSGAAQAILRDAAGAGLSIKGYQGVALSAQRGVLVARAQAGVAEAARA